MTKSIVGLHEESELTHKFVGVRVFHDGRLAVPLADKPEGEHPDWEFIEMDDDDFLNLPVY